MAAFYEEIPENHYEFSWDKITAVEVGRKKLGQEMPVSVYRLLEYSMRSVLYEQFGAEKTNELFRDAGFLAGSEFARHELDLTLEPNRFLESVSKRLEAMKLGIMRIETTDFEKGEFVFAIYEDLDCSGLPVTNEVVCNYDEGFLAGVLQIYLKKPVCVREVDCWATGERVCRFKGSVVDGESRI